MSNKSRNRAAQAATPVQQPETVAPWLRDYVTEFSLLEEWLNGNTSVADQVAAAFAAKIESENGRHRGPIDGHLHELVIVHMVEPTFFPVVYGTKHGSYKQREIEEALQCASEAGTSLEGWNREDGLRVIGVWRAVHAKNPTTTTTPGGKKSILAMLSQGGSNPVQRRFPLFYAFATSERRNRNGNADEGTQTTAMEVARLDTQIAELEVKESAAVTAKDYAKAGELASQIAALRVTMAKLSESPAPPVEEEQVPASTPTVEEQIDALEVEKSNAVKAEDYTKAGQLASQIAALRATITTTAAPAPTPAPAETPVADAPKGNGADTLSLAQAITICKREAAKTENANKRLRKTFSRYENDDNFGDDDFVATVQALM